MVQAVQDIQVINIDSVPYAVDAMSETAQRLVGVYNGWNQKEADIRDELMVIQAAKETLSRQIIEQVRAEKAEAEAKTEDGPAVEDQAEPVVAEISDAPEAANAE